MAGGFQHWMIVLHPRRKICHQASAVEARLVRSISVRRIESREQALAGTGIGEYQVARGAVLQSPVSSAKKSLADPMFGWRQLFDIRATTTRTALQRDCF